MDVGLEAGVALSDDGKARAGMGVDAGDFDNSRRAGPRRHQFRRRDDRALSRRSARAASRTSRRARASARRPETGSASAVSSPISTSTAALDLIVANGHIDDTVRNIGGNVGHAQPPQLFLNQGDGAFRDVAARRGRRLRPGRGSAAASPAATSIATATSTC